MTPCPPRLSADRSQTKIGGLLFCFQVNDEKRKALGIDGFVMKPLIMKEIAATIRNVPDT